MAVSFFHRYLRYLTNTYSAIANVPIHENSFIGCLKRRLNLFVVQEECVERRKCVVYRYDVRYNWRSPERMFEKVRIAFDSVIWGTEMHKATPDDN